MQLVCLVSSDCNVVSLAIFEDVFFKVSNWSFIRCFLNRVPPNFLEKVWHGLGLLWGIVICVQGCSIWTIDFKACLIWMVVM